MIEGNRQKASFITVAAILSAVILAGCSRPLAPSLNKVDLQDMLRDDIGIGSRAEIQVYMLEHMESKTPEQKTDLAARYYVGSGAAKDVDKGRLLFQESAEEGNPKAQFCLAVLYGKDESVPESAIEAMKWLLIAERGDGDYARPAKIFRTRLEGELSLGGQEIARSRADKWLSLHDSKRHKESLPFRGRSWNE